MMIGVSLYPDRSGRFRVAFLHAGSIGLRSRDRAAVVVRRTAAHAPRTVGQLQAVTGLPPHVVAKALRKYPDTNR